MVTKEEYENEILSSISELWNLCTSCGECCKKLAIPLHPLELPRIARMFEDEDNLRLHIQRNPYPFNIQSEYFFKVDSVCPFLVSSECRIYSKRPLGCQLFPVRVIAYLDYPSERFREPLFQIVSGESHLPCMMNNILMNERIGIRMRDWGKPGENIINYVVAAVVDDLGFAYLFGQEPKRGVQAFSPQLDELKSGEIFQKKFSDALFNNYHIPNLYTVEAWERLVPLDDDEIDNLRSRKHLLNAAKRSSRLLKRMRKHKHPLLQWREHILH